MSAEAKPSYDALAAENARLRQAARLHALAPRVCLLCLEHRITLDALARLDRELGIPEST